jgi:hypothetical protein
MYEMRKTRDETFGPPPVLSDESITDYDKCYRRIFDYFRPKDAIEIRLVRDYADHDWDIIRWRRRKVELMSDIPEMYLDRPTAMLIRAERINQLIENAERGRNRSYRDIIRHRDRSVNEGPHSSKSKPRSDHSAD